jgi:hypothetical protein
VGFFAPAKEFMFLKRLMQCVSHEFVLQWALCPFFVFVWRDLCFIGAGVVCGDTALIK